MKNLLTILSVLIIVSGCGETGTFDESAKDVIEESNSVDKADSTYNLGMTYSANGEFDQAIKYLSEAINQGHKDAVSELAMIYSLRGEKDKAIEMLKDASEDSNEIAMAELGELYSGLDGNSDSAFYWYRMAADNNSEWGIFKMGLGYEMGYIGIENMDSALFWYNKLVEMGDCMGKIKIAQFYIEGKGFNVNVKKGIEELERIADECPRDAYYDLGKLYEDGIKVKKNLKKAKEYYRKSQENGGLMSKRRLEKLK